MTNDDTISLKNLSKPQWDAALDAARHLARANPDVASDRAAFRDARDRLASLLPDRADTRAIIIAALRWDALNEVAATFAGLPTGIEVVS